MIAQPVNIVVEKYLKEYRLAFKPRDSMRYLFSMLCSCAISCLMAEEEESAQTSILFFELGEISVPLSFYTDSWDPKQELPIFLPGGKRAEEKDLIVRIEKIPRVLEDISEEDWDERR